MSLLLCFAKHDHFISLLAVGLLVAVGLGVLVVVLVMRAAGGDGPKMPPAQAWQAATAVVLRILSR